MNIPPLDLKRQFAVIKKEIMQEIEKLCDAQSFILGEAVATFEKELAEDCGVRYAIGVSSGTSALELALLALDLKPGDEVITTSFTFVATAEPILLLGGKPVFVDIHPDTYNIDPKQIEAKITPKTKAILVVHLYGQTADMAPILKLAEKHGLPVIEDTAQAMGSTYGRTGEQAGTLGTIGTLSFFPSKNLGGFGDGGAVLTNDTALAKRIQKLRVHGQGDRYHHEEIGLNARLDALQAVILRVKLKHLSFWLKERNLKARIYNELLGKHDLDNKVQVPFVEHNNYHTYHQYILKISEKRDDLLKHLQEAGIGSRVYYPIPLHLQPCFHELGYQEGDLPVSELCAKQILSLPLFPELAEEEQIYIIEKIREFYR